MDPAEGLTCLKTSESEKTSSCIELTRELEGEQDLDLGGIGGASKDWLLLGGKGGSLGGDVLGVDVITDRVGFLAITDFLSWSGIKTRLSSLLFRSLRKTESRFFFTSWPEMLASLLIVLKDLARSSVSLISLGLDTSAFWTSSTSSWDIAFSKSWLGSTLSISRICWLTSRPITSSPLLHRRTSLGWLCGQTSFPRGHSLPRNHFSFTS